MLSCVGCVVTWVTLVRGLCESVGACVAWIKFYVGYLGQNNFYVSQHITWVIICTWVARIKYIFAWVKIFCVGQFSYVGQHFLRGSKFLRGSISLEGWSKKISIGAFTVIS